MNVRFMERAVLGAAVVLCLLTGSSSRGQLGPQKHEPKVPWENKSLSPDERADLVIGKMTLDEKIQLLHGLGWEALFGPPPESGPGTRAIRPSGFIPGVPRLGIPDLQMTDAAMGVAGGGDKSRYATALPSAAAMAAGWDPALSYETGALIGNEIRAQGFNLSLGSAINLTREPRDGRIFEYMGEDPLLAGTLAGQALKAVKAQNVVTDVKHYVVNDQEAGRFFVNSVIDKRSMRESDLLAFEIVLRESNPGAVMCAYNKINGIYACEDDYTLNEVLKKELGFKGFVISDWGGTHSTVKAVLAGLDIEMPGYSFLGEPLKKAVESGEVPMARLNDMVHRILRAEFDSGIVDNPPQAHVVDVLRGFEVAQKIEEKGAVLLKNDHGQLPLNAAGIKSIAVIGGHADVGVMSGGGSGQVSPAGGSAVPPSPGGAPDDPLEIFSITVYHRSAPLKGITEKAKGAVVKFDPGTDPVSAAALAKASGVAIVFAVQHTYENMDLPNLSLPENQDALIEAVPAANPHTIVVLETGGPVTMPWIDKVTAVIEAWYPGIRGSEALANILFGDVNPSGKLPVTFARTEADLPHPRHVDQPALDPNHPITPLPNLPVVPGISTNQTPFDAVYDEGLKVGYKWYDAEKNEPLFPFGFGLSYTTYSYSALKTTSDNGLTVKFKVKNTGNRSGEETAQVYLTLPANTHEPPRRLVGWSRIALRPGEQKDVTVKVDTQMVSIFNPDKNLWEVVPGEYKVWIGRSSRDLPLSATIALGREVVEAAEVGGQPMKILFLGANGAVGQLALDDLLNANHEVTALVRSSSAMQRKRSRLTIVQGDPTNAADMEKVLAGQDVVLSTLGARTNKKTTLRADVARNLVAGMKKHGVRKLVWLDAAGVGSSKEFVQRSSFFFGRVIMPFFLDRMYEDATVADDLIEKSTCKWVIVRPMSFTNGAKTGNISVITDMSLTVRLRLRMARADVAAFLVEQVVRDDYVGQMPVIFT